MKRIFALSLALLITISSASPGYCDDPMRKLTRGICNLLTFPCELPIRIHAAYKRGGLAEGLTYGLWEGACNMVFRGAMGFYETISFPIPIPEGYEPIMTDPEFLWPFLPKR